MSLGINTRITVTTEQPSTFSRGKTLYVGGSGGDNYTKIQEAINDSVDGDTVFVYDDSSPYSENLVVNKSINLVGECRDTTYIYGYTGEAAIKITAERVNISGFSIDWRGERSIKICSDNTTITSNNILDADLGIEILSNYNFIIDNNILNGALGIEILSNYNFIIDNNISKFYFWGIYINSNYNTISGNIIKGKGLGTDSYGLELLDFSNNNTITRNIITDNLCGIYLLNSNSGNNIINNNFSCNQGTIWVTSSYNNNIVDNNFWKNWHDISLYKSYNNTVAGNTFSEIECCTCISIRYSNSNIIKDNKIIGNGGCLGISLVNHSFNNIINSNDILNSGNGICIWLSSDYNIIINNNFLNNEDGIYIYLFSSNNSIYHNNFINNEENAYDECNNTWDDGKYGNYWSDYKKRYPDAKKIWLRGIWDTPYEIAGGSNKDRCPLIKQWTNSLSRAMPRNRATYNMLFLRFLEQFPILQKILDFIL